MLSSMKGVETYSGLRMSEVIYQVTGIPFERIAVLSGPNLAREIAGGQAAASVVAPDETAPHDGGRTGHRKQPGLLSAVQICLM